MDVSSVERMQARLPWWVGPLALTVIAIVAGMAFAYGRLLVEGSSGGNSSGNSATSPASANAQTAPDGSASQTVEGNGVSLTLTWQGKEAGPVFSVAMDTHSGSLDGYDLARLAVLRTDSGQEVTPVSWDAPKGGHHRKGTLTFPDKEPNGKPLAANGSGKMTVVIKDVAGVPERVFTWTP